MLEVRDDTQLDSKDLEFVRKDFSNKRKIVVFNKCDISGRIFGEVQEENSASAVAISATTQQGIDTLEKILQDQLGYQGAREDTIMARRRHIESMQRAHSHLDQAINHFESTDLLAEEIRLAQNALGEITGAVTVEDLLGDIFSTFCIGK